nr:hypothetical protein MZNIZDYX_MZNIZDYX_CDS_0031 [uncultured phage]CAI9752150.1 hypothetical protein GCSOEBMH_GCSOEBMH_CDS_0031 [uncultured phage]
MHVNIKRLSRQDIFNLIIYFFIVFIVFSVIYW